MHNFEASPGYQTQHYLRATAANQTKEYLYTSFAAVPNGNCFYGCLWVRASSPPGTPSPTIITSLNESVNNGAHCQYLGVLSMGAGSAKFILGLGTFKSSDATVTDIYTIETPSIAVSANRWYKIQFLFNSATTTLSDNVININNIAYTPVLRAGSQVATVYDYTIHNLFQSKIPINTCIAQVWIGAGAMTKTEFLKYRFGKKAPLWLDDLGSSAGGRPALIYMHGTKMIVENSVNNVPYIEERANFTSLVHVTSNSDRVVLV